MSGPKLTTDDADDLSARREPMRQLAHSRLSLYVGLLSLAAAACSGAGSDGLITVGVRPTAGVLASDGTASSVGALPTLGPESGDVIPLTVEGNGTVARGVSVAGASAASAGSGARDGSGTSARGGQTAFPDAEISGPADAGTNAADAGGSLAANEDECGAIPSQPSGKVTSVRVSGPGLVEYDVNAPNVFTALRTTMAVPAEPAPSGSIFIWSGLQPTLNGMNFQPIGNGALLPALTWGPACAADAPASYSTWWIAPMYSNISSADPQYAGCHIGQVLPAEPQQLLDIKIRLDGTKWVQTVVNRDTLEASDFSLDLKGQAQGRAIFTIELQTSNEPTQDIVFTNTVLSMDMSETDACQPVMSGMNDFASKPRISADGKHCCIDRIVLRAPGVAATTMDPP